MVPPNNFEVSKQGLKLYAFKPVFCIREEMLDQSSKDQENEEYSV